MTTQLRYLIGAAAGLVVGVLMMSFASSLRAQDATNAPNAVVEAAPVAGLQTPQSRNASLAPRATTTSRAATTTAATQEPTQSAESTRSWKKSALIIGGSAGAGAGIGGAVNGGKGALIGAAIGGGAAAIYEAIKRKD